MIENFKKARDEFGDNYDLDNHRTGPRGLLDEGADWAYEWCQKKLHIMSEQLKNAKADREEAIFRERIAESESRDFLSESDERLKELNLLRAKLKRQDEMIEECEAGLKESASHYFDGTKEQFACATCDMGGSGRSKNRSDGHDDDCFVAQAQETLTKLKQLRESE